MNYSCCPETKHSRQFPHQTIHLQLVEKRYSAPPSTSCPMNKSGMTLRATIVEFPSPPLGVPPDAFWIFPLAISGVQNKRPHARISLLGISPSPLLPTACFEGSSPQDKYELEQKPIMLVCSSLCGQSGWWWTLVLDSFTRLYFLGSPVSKNCVWHQLRTRPQKSIFQYLLCAAARLIFSWIDS